MYALHFYFYWLICPDLGISNNYTQLICSEKRNNLTKGLNFLASCHKKFKGNSKKYSSTMYIVTLVWGRVEDGEGAHYSFTHSVLHSLLYDVSCFTQLSLQALLYACCRSLAASIQRPAEISVPPTFLPKRPNMKYKNRLDIASLLWLVCNPSNFLRHNE